MNILEESLLMTISPLSKFWDKMKEFEREEKEQREQLIEKPHGEDQEAKKLEFYLWHQEKNFELLECFGNEVKDLEQKQKYYFGCSFKVYSKHYEERLRRFLKKYEDATEIDFIEEELQIGIFHLPYKEFEQFIFSEIEKKFYFALKKRLQFLTERASDLGFKVIYIPEQENLDGTLSKETFEVKSIKPTNSNNVIPIENSFTPTQILELARALIETGKIEGNIEDNIKRFSEFFKVEINNPSQLWQAIKGRKNGGETLFLDQLKKTLMDSFKR